MSDAPGSSSVPDEHGEAEDDISDAKLMEALAVCPLPALCFGSILAAAASPRLPHASICDATAINPRR